MKRIYRIVRWAVALFLLSSVLVTLLYRWVNVPLTPLMVIRCVQQAGRGEQVRLHYKWVPLSQMSRYLSVAVIASEDQNFFGTPWFRHTGHRRCHAGAYVRWSGERRQHDFAANGQECVSLADLVVGA